MLDDWLDEKDLDDDEDCEFIEVCCWDFWTEVEEDIWLLKEFCCCWWLLLLLKEVSCFELELNTELFSWRGAVLKPACWKGVPTLRTSSSTFSSAKLDNCCFVSRFRVEFCSALEKLTVAPRCW